MCQISKQNNCSDYTQDKVTRLLIYQAEKRSGKVSLDHVFGVFGVKKITESRQLLRFEV